MARRKGETCPYRARPFLDALPRFSTVVPHEEKGRDEKRRGGEDRAAVASSASAADAVNAEEEAEAEGEAE